MKRPNYSAMKPEAGKWYFWFYDSWVCMGSFDTCDEAKGAACEFFARGTTGTNSACLIGQYVMDVIRPGNASSKVKFETRPDGTIVSESLPI